MQFLPLTYSSQKLLLIALAMVTKLSLLSVGSIVL
jgi:hypothetical protein